MSKHKNQNKKRIDFSKYYPLIFTIIFVVILFQYSFSTLEAIFYDLRVQYDFGIEQKDRIVLITLDEESDEFLGETYPYTYVSHQKMFEKLASDNPSIISYLTSLNEPGEFGRDMQNFRNFKNEISDYISNGGVFLFGTQMDAWGEQLPPRDLREFGYSLALINVDNSKFSKDDISRRMLLNISGEDSFHLSIANSYREIHNKQRLSTKDIQGSHYVRKADATFTHFRYYTEPLDSNVDVKTIPFHRVRTGNFPPGFFKDKIVLIGSSYISNASDYVLTPFNREEYKAPKLRVHAALIESILQQKTVYQIPRVWTYAFCILIALVLSLMISNLRPTRGLLMTLVIMVGTFALSHILFSFFGLWFYVSHIVLTIFVVYYIWVPFRAIGEYQRRYAIQEETRLRSQLENLKQNFISLMSHDLKTPVAKISGLADLSMRQSENDEVKKNLRAIVDSTKDLNKFITSILDLTKVESQNLNLNKSSKDINKIIEETIKGLQYEAERKEVKIHSDLGPLYPIQIDVNLMRRVLSNLIENAVKYSGKGSVVEVKSWDDEKWVTLEIRDNGVGISSDDLKHIFDKFYRVKNDASHSIKGTGLGLYLVKYFVELHGGNISVDSVQGEGTTFTLKLVNQ